MTRTERGLAALGVRLGLLAEGAVVKVHRVHAGHCQRSCGAWSWFVTDEHWHELFGSQYTAAEVVRAGREGRVYVNHDADFHSTELVVLDEPPTGPPRKPKEP